MATDVKSKIQMWIKYIEHSTLCAAEVYKMLNLEAVVVNDFIELARRTIIGWEVSFPSKEWLFASTPIWQHRLSHLPRLD